MIYKNIIRAFKAPYRLIQLSMALPCQFNDNDTRVLIIQTLGKHAIGFARAISELAQTHRALLTSQSFQLLLQAGPNYDCVIKAFIRLHAYQKGMANNANLERLVKLGSFSEDYVQNFITQDAAAQNLFETRSSKKNVKLIGSLNSNTPFSHKISRSVKEKRLSANGQFDFDTKQWVSKSSQRVKTGLTQIRWLVFIAKFKSKAFFNKEDLQSLQEKCYQNLAALYQSNSGSHQSNTMSVEELELFIKTASEMNPDNVIYQGYSQIMPQVLDALDKALQLFPLGVKLPAHDVFFEDITNILLVPENWVHMLKSAAKAEMEVVAQEMRRAFCPSDLLGVNPYPKYRLSMPSDEKHRVSLANEVPLIYISSELLNLQDGIVLQANRLNLYFQNSNRSYSKNPYPVSNIPGLGVACIFAKFLGDNDPKNGNVVVSVIDEARKDYVVVGLDSDHCFSRSESKALFSDIWEVQNNPLTRETYYHNYFFLRYEGMTPAEIDAKNSLKKSYDGSHALRAISAQKKTQRENFATAFNLAFTPPEAYVEFIEQYLSLSNPFVTGIYERVKKQVLAEQKALRDAFEYQQDFLNFFLDSDEIEDNVFHRHDMLSTQVKEFCFYKKHTFEKTNLFEQEPEIIHNYFLDFLKEKMQANPEILSKIQKQFDSWASFLKTQPISDEQSQHKKHIVLKRVDLVVAEDDDFIFYTESDKTDVIAYTPPQSQCLSAQTDNLMSYSEPIMLSRQPTLKKINELSMRI